MSTQEEHELVSFRDAQVVGESVVLSNDIERLVLLGMQKYRQSYNERMYPPGNGYLPRRARHELALYWKEEFLPSLRGPIQSLLALVDLNGANFLFDFERALKIVLEIDEIAVKIHAATASILGDSLLPSKYPDGPTEESNSEPLELFTNLPWSILNRETDDFFKSFDECFTIRSRSVRTIGFRRPASWHLERNTAGGWFYGIKQLSDFYLDDDKFYFISLTLNRTEYQLYTQKWVCITRDITGHLEQVASDIVHLEVEPKTTASEQEELIPSLPSAPNRLELLYMAWLPILKLSRLLLRKLFCEYTSDTILMHQMSTNLLEGLFQLIGFIAQWTTPISDHILTTIHDTKRNPDELLGVEENQMVPGRELFHNVDNCFKGVLRILNQHFDRLSTRSDSHPPTIEYARKWRQNWKVQYNLAVRNLLTAYKDLYSEEWADVWDEIEGMNPDGYYGRDIE